MSFLDRILAMNAAQSGGPFRADRPSADTALSGGRHPVLENPRPHTVFGTPITGPWKDGQEHVVIGLGCFWGAEKLFWQLDGVESTSVGYAGGYTPNPTYREVCTGRTGHSEVVDVVFDPERVDLRTVIRTGLENHDPTQGDRQGNDVGSQYRSVIYTTTPEQRDIAATEVDAYGKKLAEAGYGAVTTEVSLLSETPAGEYYLAEDEHQQYLDKNPGGYCPVHATGVTCG
ncbi:peptide-methionine (S)-S-oxide reductase MsrA [Corynebacterium glyciniphilum]|uniref:peptide-methionine (S)-S-oxide reductase MsrA n=1 Tax=Corynebacterium glyciniphilum TaxID=1404244 RepID=UPI002655CC48|nr:peptide-methionine (S)-S-oxide reductase MsrA [Corynebacterium glyciniphilum]MDN5684344.1 peptide-methionine (S)-S-oxide reductase MsrA [Corynebacterium glyciniphilum]